MNYLRNEEKKFKSYLKKKVSFDLQTLVKFLITGVVAISVTACGGGGGGGGSSSSASGNDTLTSTQTPDSGKEYTTDKNISITSANAIGIIGNSSDITNTKTIRISNQYSKINNLSNNSEILAKIKELGIGAGIFGEDGILTNEGNIILSGNNAAGIIGAYSEIVNENNIKTEGTTEDMIGILSLGSNVTNNGTIDINSLEGTGIYVYNDIEVEGIPVGNEKTINITNNRDIKVTGESVEGIYVEGKNVTVTNGKEGNITINNIIEGKSKGHNSYGIKGENIENIHIINDGDITLNVDSKLTQTNGQTYKNIGMGIDGSNSSIINNGNISIDVSENPEGVVGIGISSSGSNKIENNGIITIKGNKVLIPKDGNLTSEELEQLVEIISTGIKIEGVSSEENMLVNSSIGTINISGSSIGIYSKNSNVENAGTINLSKENFSDKEVPTIGMGVNGGKGINSGVIQGGGNYSFGMFTFNGGTIINEGTIELVGDNIEGMVVDNKGTAINDGTIKLTGDNLEGMVTSGNGVAINNKEIELIGDNSTGIEIDGGTGKNEGTITITGTNSIGMRSDINSEIINNNMITINDKSIGMLTDEGKATNNGTIEIGSSSQGMIAQSSGSQVINEENGVITVSGEYSYGMIVRDGENVSAINKGKIDVSKNSIGIFAELGGNAINTGKIDIVENAYGMSANKGTIENGTEGKISLTNNSKGMSGSNSSILINKGTIDITGNSSIGMEGIESDITNEKSIIINGKIQIDEQEIDSNENIGILANNSSATNAGIIELNTTINDTIYKGEYPLNLPYTVGMLGKNKSIIENNIKIEGTGNLIGMRVTSNSTGRNNGDINLTSGKINSDVIMEQGDYYKYNYDKFFYTDAIGMKAEGQGSKITNNKNITIDGKGMGMVADNEATGINNGNITMTSGEIHKKGYSESVPESGKYNDYELVKSWEEVIGMSSDNGNITNGESGTITIDGNGKGMYGTNNSNLINNGNIIVNGKMEYVTPTFTDEEEIPTNYDFIFGIPVSGMEIENGGKAENNGKIVVNTEYYQKEFLYNEMGKSYLRLDAYSAGIYVNNSVGINGQNGIIEIKGSTVGMLGQSGASLENNGSIVLTQGTPLTTNGNNFFETVGMAGNNSEIVNNGKIISKEEVITDRVIGIYSEKGSVQNNGDIEILGDFSIGIEGIDSNVINQNNITMNGKYVSGIFAENGEITNNGTISIESQNQDYEQNPRSYSSAIEVENGKITNNGFITGNGNKIVGLDGYNSEIVNNKDKNIELTGSALTGIYTHQGGSGINNGNIAINVTENSDIGSTGILLEGNGSVENKGTIDINGNKVEFNKETPIEQFLSKISSGIKVTNNQNTENLIVNNSNGIINISGSGVGIIAQNSNVENKGTINLENGVFEKEEITPIGMFIYKGNGTNNGKILGINSHSSSAMNIIGGGTITNGQNGLIELSGNNIEGMSTTKDGIAINYGEIKVNGTEAIAMEIDNSYNNPSGEGHSSGENYGVITVTGTDAIGMRADVNSSITNKKGGTITVIGSNSVGMEADEGGIAINEEGATIKVGNGAYGMVADGGRAINQGTIDVSAGALGGMVAKNNGHILNDETGVINIDKSHEVTEEKKEGFALKTESGGTFENKGQIFTNGEVKIELGSSYTVGTNSDGTFGKLTASDIDLNGNLVISTNMIKGSYEKSYKLDNMIEGKNINLGEEYKNLSNSLLYDAKTSKDEEGNLDGELVRNNNSISDFTSNHLTQVGELFDKYLAKENYEKLSQEDKELVDKIFASTGSATDLKDAIDKVSGQEYLNISSQIFDIKDSFRKYDTSVISTLDKYDYNFTLIGEYGDIQSKDGVVGYDTKMTGFNGAMRLADNLYGTLGYGYSDINYDNSAEGKIQTIHAGLYRDYSYNKSNIRVGTFGEYNFHETDRENLDGYVNTDYNSYLVGVTGEVSKKYGDTLYIQPRLALDIAYGNVENFSEDNLEIKEQDYTSVLPKAELIIGKKLNNIELFAKSSYSYELGNLDKDMDIKLLNNTVGIDNDTMDKGNLDLSIGTELNFESLSLNAELGKEFGKRDREYIKAGITYKF